LLWEPAKRRDDLFNGERQNEEVFHRPWQTFLGRKKVPPRGASLNLGRKSKRGVG